MDVTPTAVYVAEGSFGLLDAGDVPADTADWSNGLVAVMTRGALIATGIHTGYVHVQAVAELRPPEPAPRDGRWEEIVEVTVQAPQGNLKIESLEKGPATALPRLSVPGVATYRVRIHARGRETAFDQVRNEPVEDYLVQAWPTDTDQPTVIIRSSNRIERELRTPYTRPVPAATTPDQDRQKQLRQRLLRGGATQT